MGKRTPQSGLSAWEEAPGLNAWVVDKRPAKRAGRAKARRRDRRYKNRLLRATLEGVDLPAASPDAGQPGHDGGDRQW